MEIARTLGEEHYTVSRAITAFGKGRPDLQTNTASSATY